MTEGPRVAAYYAPQRNDPLFTAGAVWLGRDPESNAPQTQPPLPGIGAVTADARRYGFHATLKPPMRLRPETDWFQLLEVAREVARSVSGPFALPPLEIAEFDGFIALRESAPCPPLQALADACVRHLDPFRAPPDPAELERRRLDLTSEQENMLTRWGYPYVFGTWFFHMTLTRRLSAEELAYWRPHVEAHFAPSMSLPRRVSDLCLFTQPMAGAPFTVAERIALSGRREA